MSIHKKVVVNQIEIFSPYDPFIKDMLRYCKYVDGIPQHPKLKEEYDKRLKNFVILKQGNLEKDLN